MKNDEFYDSVKNIMKEIDMSDEDIYNYFYNEIKEYKNNIKNEKTFSKELYKKLKNELRSNYYLGLNKKVLPYSVHYADILRHNSYDNKVVLYNYAQFSIKHLYIGNVEVYKKFKDYTIKYDKLANLMANKILSHDEDLDLIDVNNYVEESINRLNNENEYLTSDVFQIARIKQKVKSKRII